jgi:4-nitrophenyl phosphatase
MMEGAVVDVDGTVLRGGTLLEGARDGLDALRESGVRIAFVSNNPTLTSDGLTDRLRTAGVETEETGTLTSATLTARYVDENCAPPVHVTGEGGVVDALRDRGVTVTEEPDESGTAVVSVDRSLGYDDIREAFEATRTADDYVCTDPDAVVPTGDGDIPGSGAVEAAVSRAAGREPFVVGKPSEYAGSAVLGSVGASPEDTLFIGDRLDTDIALGESVGATTALVRTGVTDDAALAASPHTPDHVLDTLADVADLL